MRLSVRKALKHAINREEMVDKILLGHGKVANDHPIGPANQYFASDLEQNAYDIDKAKFYMKEWTCPLPTRPLLAPSMQLSCIKHQPKRLASTSTSCKSPMTATGPTFG